LIMLVAVCNLLLIFALIADCSSESQHACEFSDDVSPAMNRLLCAVEQGRWFIPQNATALRNAGCLLGGKGRCDSPRKVPLESEIPKSQAPPAAKNRQYQALAMKAEELVPKIWWRDGFDSALLLLSAEDRDLPRKQFDASRLSSKKLKNMHQCVTRQQFIRRSMDFDESSSAHSTAAIGAGEVEQQQQSKCAAMKEPVVSSFFEMWNSPSGLGRGLFGGVLNRRGDWSPSRADKGKLLVAALEVLEHFYTNYGGVWTGCFKLEKSPSCRGALAAAALVSAVHILYDVSGRRKDFSESTFVSGYMLASLGRGLLHGHSGNTGGKAVGVWQLRLADFVSLQQAFLKLYLDSFGALYENQLEKHLPITFPPTFRVHAKEEWKHLAGTKGGSGGRGEFEPVYTSLRNWMFHESSNLIDFGPYRPLTALQEVQTHLKRQSGQKRRVLIDVGANGFFASPKYLLDSYAPYIPFTHAIMIEPEPHFSATVPKVYSDRYNISFLQIYAEVNTGSATDIIKLLPSLVSKDDFVVLKFDVDPNRYAQGPTMEWGFLFDLMQNEASAKLVDETYIELHFRSVAMLFVVLCYVMLCCVVLS